MPTVSLKYVVSFSSQDDRHPVSNLIKGDGYKKWLSGPQEKGGQIEAVFQLEQPCKISYIDVGSIWCATLEIKVGRSEWPAGREFETLVYTVSLMTPTDCSYGKNPIKTQMFSGDKFCPDIADKQWDRVKVVCRQPYKKATQFGLSFLRVKTTASIAVNGTGTVASRKTSRPELPVHSIQKHFLGKLDNKQKAGPDELKTRLLKISASSDSGVEHGDSLSRTAKLVLAATGPKPKAYSSDSTAPGGEKKGMFSSHIDQKYGPKFGEEVSQFLDKLDINSKDLDSITLADVRHRFEKRKKRKLTKEEKREFITMAKEYLQDMFSKKARQEPSTKPDNLSKPGNKTVTSSSLQKMTPGSANADKSIANNSSKVGAMLTKDLNKEVTKKSTTREVTPSGKRKLNISDDRMTPPSKKVLTEKFVSVKQQMKSYEQSPTNSKPKPVNESLRDKLSAQKLPGLPGQITPASPFEYRGLRGGDLDLSQSDEPLHNKQSPVTKIKDVVTPKSKNTPAKTKESLLFSPKPNFGSFGLDIPWSPADCENSKPGTRAASGTISRSKSRGRGSTRGRGRGSGRKKIGFPSDIISDDSDDSDTCDEINIESPISPPEVRGRGRGRGRGRKKNNETHRNSAASMEIRPTGFAKCDGCNEYFGENLLSVHQQRCSRWKGLQTGTSPAHGSPWLSSKPGSGRPAPKTTPARNSSQADTTTKSRVGSSVKSSDDKSVKSPPWLLAAEKRLQQQSSQNSQGTGQNNTSNITDNTWPGDSSSDTSPIIAAQQQQIVKYQTGSSDISLGSNRSTAKTQNKSINIQNQSRTIKNDNQSAYESFGFSLGFSPSDTVDITDVASDVSSDSDYVPEAGVGQMGGDYGQSSVTTEGVPCPLCGDHFPSYIIEMHAASCLL